MKNIQDYFKKKQVIDQERENQEEINQRRENQGRENKEGENQNVGCSSPKALDLVLCDSDSPPCKYSKIETVESIVRDPGLRRPIWEISVNERDEVRRAYINYGSYQHKLHRYPVSGPSSHPRKFQASWFQKFPWLEYSPKTDSAYCLPCYLFSTPYSNDSPFITEGFRVWKRVGGNEKQCAFRIHEGTSQNSPHNMNVSAFNDLSHQSKYIDKMIGKKSSELVQNNRLRLKASVDAIRWLAFQACAFRGHDESSSSMNQGNFIEFIKTLASYNDKVAQVVLDNAPKNAKYTSPTVQKEILHVFASKVRAKIIEEIGDAKYCIIIDEARDESKREQMAVVLRFVNKEGQVQERFLSVVHVRDTTAITLKNAISALLSQHNLSIQDIRGQGYDGASNMRGELNGLQALILNECPYAYYVHCFAHRLQLALVAASKEVGHVHKFFEHLTYVINVVSASSKRNDELHEAQANEFAFRIAIDELETGKGLNQIGSLQRPGDTRWGSHFVSVCSLLKMFNATCVVLENLRDNGSTSQIRGEGLSAYDMITSFDFVFILHLVQQILGHSDTLCQSLQRQRQDILNAMTMVCNSKRFLQELRENGWDSFIQTVGAFCVTHDIPIPDMDAQYFVRGSRSRRECNFITVGHHYHVDIFIAAIDSQLVELNSRFNENSMEILRLMSTFDPRDQYESFNVQDAYTLAEKFYPEDFLDSDLMSLNYQLMHYKNDICHHPSFQNLGTLSDVCQAMVHSRKNEGYPYVYRLLSLILTLPVSTATTERAFSAMKLIKTRLRNKMEDEFFADCLLLYIEKEIAQMFDSNDIIDAFYKMKSRRAQLQ